MTAFLPPGVDIPRPDHDVPVGAGRALVIDPSPQFYLAKAEHVRDAIRVGRPLIFTTEELLHACVEYFAWCDVNKLTAEKTQFSSKHGMWAKTDVNFKRPYTHKGLCLYLNVTHKTWIEWRNNGTHAEVISAIDDAIYNQKFEGAVAGFFNATIISRDLGLVDKQELTGAGGGPLRQITSDMSEQEAADAYAAARDGGAT